MTRVPEQMTDEQIADELRRIEANDWKVSRYARGNMAVRKAELVREQERRETFALAAEDDRITNGEMRPPSLPIGAVLAEQVEAKLRGHVVIVNVRLNALRAAITERDWERVEWEYDRVTSSVGKLDEVLRGER